MLREHGMSSKIPQRLRWPTFVYGGVALLVSIAELVPWLVIDEHPRFGQDVALQILAIIGFCGCLSATLLLVRMNVDALVTQWLWVLGGSLGHVFAYVVCCRFWDVPAWTPLLARWVDGTLAVSSSALLIATYLVRRFSVREPS
jgi:hypothetical protein